MTERNVSVIIPTYNRAHVLHKTIPTYIQDITMEVIIIDDGSNDNTQETVRRLHKKYAQIRYIKLKKHKGLPGVKNIGVKCAKGKYIYFGDDDDCLYAGSLLRLREALEKFPADIAGTNGYYATEMKQLWGIDDYIKRYCTKPFKGKCILDFNTGRFDFHYKIEHITEGLYVMACFMIRTELAKQSYFDPCYIGNAAREDMDYLLRQAKRGSKMVYVPDAYAVGLPRDIVRGGGCQSQKLWKRAFYTIRNHNIFLNRHYVYLKQEGYISVTKVKAMKLLVKDIMYGLYIAWKQQIKENFFLRA